MKKFLLLFIIISAIIVCKGQNQGQSFYLNQPLHGSQDFEASDLIDMSPAFSYDATQENNQFSASINQNLIYPPTNGTTGGPGGEVGNDGIVGLTEGEFSVNEYGEATYVIPLKFPAGISGMTPELSLVYRSNISDGILGPRWSLGGLSVISCVQATRYHHGVRDASFGGDYFDDTYTLDGKRLIKVANTTSYGTEFRTEQDTYSRIIRKNRINKRSDPDVYYFEVQTKDGLTYYYGNKDNSLHKSRLSPTGQFYVASYYLDSIEDNFKNKIRFNYDNPTKGGEIYISDILYTETLKNTADYRIHFNYIQTKPLISFTSVTTGTYDIPIEFTSQQVISSIQCYYSDKLVKEYLINYTERGPGSDLSIKQKCINDIQEVAYDELQQSQKYNKTVFKWENEMNYENFISEQIILPSTYHQNIELNFGGSLLEYKRVDRVKNYYYDINNDYKIDVLRIYELTHAIQISIHNVDVKHYFVYEVLINNGSSFDLTGHYDIPAQPQYTSAPSDIMQALYQGTYIGDYNGNGILDIVSCYHQNPFLDGSNGFNYKGFDIKYFEDPILNEFSCESVYSSLTDTANLMTADFNADCIQDIAIHVHNRPTLNKVLWLFGNTNNSLNSNVDEDLIYDDYSFDSKEREFFALDVNGDGRSELCHKERLYTGKTYVTFLHPSSNASSNIIQKEMHEIPIHMDAQFAHLNSDQKIDYALNTISHTELDTEIHVTIQADKFLSNGVDFFSSNSQIIESTVGVPEFGYYYDDYNVTIDKKTTPVDFNGDGIHDILLRIKFHFTAHPRPTEPGEPDPNPATSPIVYKNFILYNNPRVSNFIVITSEDLDLENNLWDFAISDLDFDHQTDFVGPNILISGLYRIQRLIPSAHGSRINKIINPLGSETIITYNNSSDNEIYSSIIAESYPIKAYNSTQYLVKKVEKSNGIGGFFTQKYFYESARLHAFGKGYLGFKKIISTNETEGTQTINEYAIDDTYYFQYPSTTVLQTLNGNRIQESVFEFMPIKPFSENYYSILLRKKTTKFYEIESNTPFKIEVEDYSEYDKYGNCTSSSVSQGISSQNQMYVTSNNIKYNNLIGDNKWVIGRLYEAVITTSSPGTNSISKKSTFKYYDDPSKPEFGMLKEEISFPDSINIKLTKTYSYDEFGNIDTTKIQGIDIADRCQISKYSSNGRFNTSSINGLNFETSRNYNPFNGLLNNETDINGLVTHHFYNNFGTREKVINADGTQILEVLRWVQSNDENAPDHACYYSWVQKSGTPPQITYYDMLGRELRVITTGFDGRFVYIDKKYDNNGLLEKISNPYFNNETKFETEYEYDVKRRIKSVKDVDDHFTIYDYEGLKSTKTNQLQQKTIQYINPAGWLIRTEDALHNIVINDYYSDGNLHTRKVEGYEGTARSYIYYGNGKIASISSSFDSIKTFKYYTTGELKEETTINEFKTTYEYDVLGRVNKVISPESIKTWIYDEDYKNTVSSIKVENQDGILHNRIIRYDEFTRPKTIDNLIDGVVYSETYTYDEIGRLKKYKFPSELEVINQYNQYGYHYRSVLGNNEIIWQINDKNAKDQIENIALGNKISQVYEYYPSNSRIRSITGNYQSESLTWDEIGNLDSKSNRYGLTEDFKYDDLNRIDSILVNNQLKLNLSYDAVGNISYKSDVGSYHYVTDNPYILSTINSQPLSINSFNQNIYYTSFNKVYKITEKDPITNQVQKQLDIIYGIDDNKIVQVIRESDVITEKSIFVNSSFEIKVSNNEIHQLHYISSPTGLCAIIDKKDNQPYKIDYVLNDYLGSVNVILNEDGSLKQEFSYDAWGVTRDPKTLLNFVTFDKDLITLGYTGHQHLDLFSLINMGGRIYDPILGRFLSVDPVIQFPNLAQGLNPYSYAFNNPLKYTDPNGCTFVGEFAAIVFSAIVTLATENPLVGAAVYSIIMTGDQMYETGASLNASFFSDYILPSFAFNTFAALITNGIGTAFKDNFIYKALAHATFNGTLSLAQGGRFEHGFFAALIPSITAPLTARTNSFIRLVVGSISGGISSKIGGGKFANGAVTGAFVILFNELLHENVKKANARDLLIERISAATDLTLYEIENLMTKEYLTLDQLKDAFIAEGKSIKQIESILDRTAKVGGFAHIGSKLLFWGSVGYTSYTVITNPSAQNIALGIADLSFAYVGTYYGGIGLAISLAYVAGKEYAIFLFECYEKGILKQNRNMMNNYVGGLMPTPFILEDN